jgi:hypothetical protein
MNFTSARLCRTIHISAITENLLWGIKTPLRRSGSDQVFTFRELPRSHAFGLPRPERGLLTHSTSASALSLNLSFRLRQKTKLNLLTLWTKYDQRVSKRLAPGGIEK